MLGKHCLLFEGFQLTRENVHVVGGVGRNFDDLPSFQRVFLGGLVRHPTHYCVTVAIVASLAFVSAFLNGLLERLRLSSL